MKKLKQLSESFSASSFSEWPQRWFPERQIYFRSNGEVHFFALSTRLQLVLVLVLLMAFGWVSVTSAKFLLRDSELANREATIQNMATTYSVLENEMSVLQGDIMTRAQKLEERQRYLHQLVSQDPEIAPQQLLPEINDAATGQNDDLQKDSNLRIEPRPIFAGLISPAMASSRSRISPVESIATLRKRLTLLDTSQDDIARRFSKLTQRRMERINEEIAPTKLKLDDLLALWTTGSNGVGGPYVPDDGSGPMLTPDAYADENDPFLLLRLDWEKLQTSYAALQSFPAGVPADDYYKSSNYGRRVDPFTKKSAIHPGVDLAGWPGNTIRAGGAGKVVKAGHWGAYGTMVEIDHGNGFRTRYGHMRKLTVKRGETVTTGQQIGEMGSTGRATSTHLHYEVWFAGKTRDPLPFIKVSENVLKIQNRTRSQ